MGNKTLKLFTESRGKTFLKGEKKLCRHLIYVVWLQPGSPALLSKSFLIVMTSQHKTHTWFTPLFSCRTFPATFGDGDHLSCASDLFLYSEHWATSAPQCCIPHSPVTSIFSSESSPCPLQLVSSTVQSCIICCLPHFVSSKEGICRG